MLRDLVTAARAVDTRKGVRAVVLSGNGPSSSSGPDIAAAIRNSLAIVRAADIFATDRSRSGDAADFR